MLRKAERHCGKQIGVAESRKLLTEIGKPLRKIGKPLRKIGKQARKIRLGARKIGFRARKIPIFPRDSLASGNFGVSFCNQICYHVRAWIYIVELEYSQLKINHHSNTPSTKGDRRPNLQWCVYKGRQVTRGSSLVAFSSNIYFKLSSSKSEEQNKLDSPDKGKTLDAMDVVQGTAED